MKQFVFWILIGCFAAPSQAQITLESCRQKAQTNYPLVRQYELIEKTKEFSVSNAAKGYLPQFSLSAKATYQSDATTINMKIGDFALNRVAPKDQYQAMVELNQQIWDGGNIHSQKELAKATPAHTDWPAQHELYIAQAQKAGRTIKAELGALDLIREQAMNLEADDGENETALNQAREMLASELVHIHNSCAEMLRAIGYSFDSTLGNFTDARIDLYALPSAVDTAE